MTEATPTKYRLRAAKYTRLEKGAMVRYEKGDVLLLGDHEVDAFGDKFEEVAEQKAEVAKPKIVAPASDMKTATVEHPAK